MFTGIVESVGHVVAATGRADGAHLRIAASMAGELKNGDSVAVNGVCLTVVDRTDDDFAADIGPETARVTSLGTLTVESAVNLERPLRLDGRLDGHLVLGHVDGVGRVENIRADGNSHWITIGFPASLAAFFLEKGSVAVDGVSLTIAALRGTQFDVQIVPFTWDHTTLSTLPNGATVNLECDMIGKYVVRALELSQPRVRQR